MRCWNNYYFDDGNFFDCQKTLEVKSSKIKKHTEMVRTYSEEGNEKSVTDSNNFKKYSKNRWKFPKGYGNSSNKKSKKKDFEGAL